VGAAVANQILWFCTNPHVGSLPHPKYRTKLLTHHTFPIYFFNCVLFVSDNKDNDFLLLCGTTVAHQTLWFFTNPYVGSLPQSNRLSKKHIFIKRYLIPHDKIGGTGQLVGKSLGGDSAIGPGHFPLIKP